MAKKENIVSYTAEELAAMRARGEGKTDWAAVDAKTDAQIAADTASDPAWDGIPEDWCEHAVPRGGNWLQELVESAKNIPAAPRSAARGLKR